MRSIRQLALFSALAAAVGGVAGVVSVVLRPVVLHDVVTPRDPAETGLGRSTDARGLGALSHADAGRDDPSSEHAVAGRHARSLTQRIDSQDVGERHSLALELLRRGPVALAQARALRPVSKAGRELQFRVVDALQKMRRLRRGGDYARLEEHLRLRLDLDAFATVVPDDRLRAERLDYWNRALEAVRDRASRGHASDGEVALAELEVARVRRELGRIDEGTYARLAAKRLSAVQEWIDTLRDDRGTSPARVRALDEHAQRLRP